MKKLNSKLLTTVVAALLLAFITFLSPTSSFVDAAAKPSIPKSMTIGTGSVYYSDPFYSKDDYYTIEVENPVKKATYTFTSSDKKVVTVKTKGNKAYLTGLKAGKATITCNQKLNGKTTKVGTCKVTVKNATFFSESYDGLPVGTYESFLVYSNYRNVDAKYTYKSNSKNFTMTEKAKRDGDSNFYIIYQTYTAKKPGTYKVTVEETYNKKTRTVGELEFEIKKATVIDEWSMYSEDEIGAFYLVNHNRSDVIYYFEALDSDIVEIYKEDDYLYIKGKNPGTTTINVYEDTTKPDKDKLIGSCKFTVNELKLESIYYNFDDNSAYVGGYPINLYVYKYPYNAPEAITVTSSDPNVAQVKEIEYYGEVYYEITPVSEGTATITITCGEYTYTETITINGSY